MQLARDHDTRQRPPSGKINFIDKILPPPPPMPAALTETTSCKFRRTTALVTGREGEGKEGTARCQKFGVGWTPLRNGKKWPSISGGGPMGGREANQPPRKSPAALGGFGRWILIGGVSGGEGEGARCRDYVQLQTKPNQTAPPK